MPIPDVEPAIAASAEISDLAAGLGRIDQKTPDVFRHRAEADQFRLALDGSLRPVPGVVCAALAASAGGAALVLPAASAEVAAQVPDCVILTPKDVSELRWMPASCSYRLVHEGKPLPNWHHLISGDRELIHRRGESIMGRTLSEDTLFDPDDVEQIEDWIVDWEGNEP